MEKNIIRPETLIIVDIVRGVNLLDTDFPTVINNVSPRTAPNIKRFPSKELILLDPLSIKLIDNTPITANTIPSPFLSLTFPLRIKRIPNL